MTSEVVETIIICLMIGDSDDDDPFAMPHWKLDNQ